MYVNAFIEAATAKDHAAVRALLSPTVTFISPVAFKPYEGKAITSAILHAIMELFEDFRYEREIGGSESTDQALVFRARIGDVEINGCDFLTLNDDGLIEEFMVMLRPMSAVNEVAQRMGERFESIAAEAAAEAN